VYPWKTTNTKNQQKKKKRKKEKKEKRKGWERRGTLATSMNRVSAAARGFSCSYLRISVSTQNPHSLNLFAIFEKFGDLSESVSVRIQTKTKEKGAKGGRVKE
jgi:hypothetical protein